jgi:hypothetical protein
MPGTASARVSRNDRPSTADFTHPPAARRAAVYPFGPRLNTSNRAALPRASISQYSATPAFQYADMSHSVSLSSELGLTTSTTRSGEPRSSVATASCPARVTIRPAASVPKVKNRASGVVAMPASSFVNRIPSDTNTPSFWSRT